MTMILACTFVASSLAAHPFMTANQFILDVENNRVEMQAAQTMATSEPMNWIFANRDWLGSRDTMFIRQGATGTVGGGFYGDGLHSFALSSDLTLRWSLVSPTAVDWFVWDCSQ